MSTAMVGSRGDAGAPQGLECASCRRPLRPDARFCTACGQPVAQDVAITVVEGAQGRARGRATAQRPQDVLHPAFGDTVPAGTGRRVAAYAIDAAAVSAVAAAVLVGTDSWLLAAMTVVELALGLVVWEAHTGRTLGNTVLGLRTAREETPYSVGPARGFLRALVLAAGHAAAGIGQWVVVASAAWDRSGRAQAWHDRVGRAVVVDVRAHERAIEAQREREQDESAGHGGRPAVAAGAPVQGTAGWGPGTAVGAGAGAGAAVGAGAHGVGGPGAVGAGSGPAMVSGAGVGVEPAQAAGGPTGRRAARAAAEAAAAGGPAASPAVPHGGGAETVAPGGPGSVAVPGAVPHVGGAAPAVRPVVPALAAPEAPATPALRHQDAPAPFVVTLDTGQAMTVTGPGLIGRAPRPTPGERCDHVIVIEDPERSVSRTHARFGIDAGTFWVSDAGSGNGTSLRLPGGRVVPVPGDQRVPVPSGSSILVGDRTVRIDAPRA